MDTLLSSTSITFERMVLVVFNSEGRRDVPLLSVATVSWVVSEALCSKISAVVLFVENISSACKKMSYHSNGISATRQKYTEWSLKAMATIIVLKMAFVKMRVI